MPTSAAATIAHVPPPLDSRDCDDAGEGGGPAPGFAAHGRSPRPATAGGAGDGELGPLDVEMPVLAGDDGRGDGAPMAVGGG